MEQWVEKFVGDNKVRYQKQRKIGILTVTFDETEGIEIDLWVQGSLGDTVYYSNPTYISIEEFEWINAKAKELFKGE